MRWVRGPVDVPEAIPGDPMLELFRDEEGVKALFQARYHPGAIDALLRAFQRTVSVVGADPEVRLEDVVSHLSDYADAFERGADEEA
tara:strand:- start:210 stop:470 length:261 start_codon:yes stop_codon:yes gene_type:complete